MALTVEQIIAVKSPSFAGDPREASFIELAECQLDETVFGKKYNLAVALLVCHWYALDAQNGGDSSTSGSGVAGGIKSEKEGDLARSFGDMKSNDLSAYYNQTTYGAELYNLIRSNVLTARNVFV